MSGAPPSRAGISAKEFRLHAAEIGNWLWGTVQGAFNEKQSLSQIITDAVIGMIPVVGDVTAARDLVAVSMGLIDRPEKRESKMEWVLLVILVFALIPVFGGVIKGVGRLALRVTSDAIKDTRALAKIAEEIIAFLNRIGHMNAVAWLKSLDVMKYQAQVLEKFRGFCDTVIVSINRYGLRFQRVLPASLVQRMQQLVHGFGQLRSAGEKMIPQALKDLHERLLKLQEIIHSGGVPSTAKVMLAQTGKKTVTYAEEARLLEESRKARVLHAGKFKQNMASADPVHQSAIAKVYRHEAGYPNLLSTVDKSGPYYPNIAAASGPIRNETLTDVVLYRSFGPGGQTRGVTVNPSYPSGAYWGVGAPPATGKEWRQGAAVMDEWNRNGWLTIVRIPAGVNVKGCTSIVSEQYSKAIAGQYLEGGSKQAFITEFSAHQAVFDNLLASGGGKTVLSNGIEIEIRPSGWRSVNGRVGYGHDVIPHAGMVERLGVTERQSKVTTQVAQAAAKQHRDNQGTQ